MSQKHFENLGGRHGTNFAKLPANEDTTRFSTKPADDKGRPLDRRSPAFREQLAAIRADGAAKLTAKFSELGLN